MKVAKFDLLEDVVSSYDQTKTTIQGRCQVNTIGGDDAIGPPLNKFVDTFTDAAITPLAGGSYLSPNGRLFAIGAETTGLSQISLHNLNTATGAITYVGKIQVALPDVAATTTTFRSLKVIDTGTSGWKIFITTTGSVALNGGTFCVNSIALSDFVPIGFPTIGFASGSDQKAVYFMQDPANIGVGHLQIASAGSILDQTNNRLYVHNGVSATHQYYVFDTSASLVYSSVSSLVIDAGTDTVDDPGHAYNNNDPVFVSSLSGGAGLTNNTVYFVRNPVAGVSYQLSATSGGAVINITTNGTATVGRAFGTSSSSFLHKTGNLPALSGVLLLTNSEATATPQHTTNSGQNCAFFATTTNIYLGQLSELTSGTTTWPSLVTANLLGTANQIVAPTAVSADWSNSLDRAVILVGGGVLIMKQCINNEITRIFGGSNNRYLEGLVSNDVVELQTATPLGINMEAGWLAMGGGATGQRGFYLADLRSDAFFDHSFFVTKVISNEADAYRFITTIDKLFDFTGSLEVYYRTSGFGSVSGGWVAVPFAEDISSLATGSQVQFKVLFSTLGLDTSIPAQICEFYLAFDGENETSDHWEYSQDDSSSGNPTDIVWRLKKVYPTSIPTLRFKANDLTNSTVTDHDSVTNVANFAYSTNDGVSWVAFGTPVNTVGTLVRYRYTTPPGVDIRPSLREA